MLDPEIFRRVLRTIASPSPRVVIADVCYSQGPCSAVCSLVVGELEAVQPVQFGLEQVLGDTWNDEGKAFAVLLQFGCMRDLEAIASFLAIVQILSAVMWAPYSQ